MPRCDRAYMIRCTDLFCPSCIYAAIPPVPAVLYMYAWYGVGIVSPVCVVTCPALRGCLWQPSFPRSVTLRCSMLSARLGAAITVAPIAGALKGGQK
nr:MAG TPA: hypothetical protein [Caudoviricetes sp.]